MNSFEASGFEFEKVESDGNTYPTSERVFYITRSLNKNLVCYDVQLENGKLNGKQPLHVYWINREEKMGEKSELTFFQKKMAYGYKLISSGDNSSIVTLTAYSGKQLKIEKHEDRFRCVTTIQNKPAVLKSLFVKSNPKNSMKVEYVELRGYAIESGECLTERVVN